MVPGTGRPFWVGGWGGGPPGSGLDLRTRGRPRPSLQGELGSDVSVVPAAAGQFHTFSPHVLSATQNTEHLFTTCPSVQSVRPSLGVTS